MNTNINEEEKEFKLTDSEYILIYGDQFAPTPKNNKTTKIIPLIFTLLILIFFLTIFISSLIEGIMSLSWPKVQGKIVSTEIIQSSDQSNTYRIQIDFLYFVNNQEFHGNKINVGGFESYDSDYDSKLKFIEEHPPGKTLDVFYESKNPSNSVLNTGVSGFSVVFFIIILVIFSAMVFVLIKEFKKTKRK